MLRRLGVILGWLFVAACLVAYPLTWGRLLVASYNAPEFMLLVNVRHGGVYFAALGLRPQDLLDSAEPPDAATMDRFELDLEPTAKPPGDALYRVELRRPWSIPGGLQFPLWLPALAVTLFLAWRWRRRRRQRLATGFPLPDPLRGDS